MHSCVQKLWFNLSVALKGVVGAFGMTLENNFLQIAFMTVMFSSSFRDHCKHRH